ncbi:glycosyl hydrolase 2 galactose-binding domain-containing protein [Vibrio neptunius]|uniref:glycosyl hydrolase 2 galactose-binding domain-containing protein n=1 Tax=Vibrio neptunius TaxID=170651 RepID=UPI0030DD191D
MQLSLAGLWQISPLTDLSVPQDDITFPAALSERLPDTLCEQEIAEQEWHLMHDIEVDEAMLAFPAVDLVLGGVDYHAEVRLNGIALFDCDGSQAEDKKDIRPYMQLGRNRFEILFLEEEEELLFEEDRLDMCPLGDQPHQRFDSRLGIWKEPYLQFIRHVRLDHVVTEQIWHHGGGCEFLVDLHYSTYKPGLISAAVKFNGMTYHLPIDVRNDHVSALFQVEAPIYFDASQPDLNALYQLEVMLDGQTQKFNIGLSKDLCVTHFPV